MANEDKGRPGGNPDIALIPKERHYGTNNQLEDSFFNANDARIEYKHEQAWHRLAVFMSAQGKTNSEIAERLGKSPVSVGQVLKQPWAQERVQREIREAGRDTLQDILNVYGPQTLLEVVDLGCNAKSESVQLGAKKELLDRWLGKPNQPMTVNAKPAEKKTDDELRASVSRVLNGLGGPSGVPSPSEG